MSLRLEELNESISSTLHPIIAGRLPADRASGQEQRALARAQTKVRPTQIRNIEQIRIGISNGDDRPLTLVRSSGGQLQNAATIEIPSFTMPYPDDQGKYTICVEAYFRVSIEGNTWPPHNIRNHSCYTQLGLLMMFNYPGWRDFWDKYKPAGTPDPVAAPDQILILASPPGPIGSVAGSKAP